MRCLCDPSVSTLSGESSYVCGAGAGHWACRKCTRVSGKGRLCALHNQPVTFTRRLWGITVRATGGTFQTFGTSAADQTLGHIELQRAPGTACWQFVEVTRSSSRVGYAVKVLMKTTGGYTRDRWCLVPPNTPPGTLQPLLPILPVGAWWGVPEVSVVAIDPLPPAFTDAYESVLKCSRGLSAGLCGLGRWRLMQSTQDELKGLLHGSTALRRTAPDISLGGVGVMLPEGPTVCPEPAVCSRVAGMWVCGRCSREFNTKPDWLAACAPDHI